MEILITLFIFLKKEEIHHGRYKRIYTKLNPWNPLTYVFLVIMFIAMMVQGLFQGIIKFCNDLVYVLKWH